MISRRTWMSVTAAWVFLAGCAFRGNVDALEAELRQREDRLADLQRQLAESEAETSLARKEANRLRDQLAGKGEPVLVQEQADLLHRLAGVKFGSLLTSGLDRDDLPGDEHLSVLLVPHDATGGLVKLPMAIDIEALDLAEPRESQKLGSWSYPIARSKALWHGGMFAAGYLVEVPWERTPAHSEITLHARITTLDGRKFDATQQLRISPQTVAASHSKNVGKKMTAQKPSAHAAPESDRDPGLNGAAPGHAEPDIEQLPEVYRDSDQSEAPAAENPGIPPGADAGDTRSNANRDKPVRTSDRWTERDIPTFR